MRLLAALLVALLPLISSAADELDDDFAAAERPPGVALGPTPKGGVILSGSIGWLMSDLTVQLGLGYWLDLYLRGDAMMLYDGLNAQNGIYAGIRLSPFDEGMARLTFTLEAGELFIPLDTSTKTVPVLRGEVGAGVTFDRYTVYGRFGIRGRSGKSAYEPSTWAQDAETGLGMEVLLSRRFILGGEVFAWTRRETDTLWNWRLRVGWSL